MVGRLRDAADVDVDARAGRQNDIHQPDFAQLREHTAWFVSQAGCRTQLAQRFPQHVAQEAHENVSQDSVFFLMPDRADRQVAVVDAECGFGFGQLDVGLPQFLGGPVGDVGAKQVTARAERGPVAIRFSLRP